MTTHEDTAAPRVEVGAELPARSKTPDEVALFLFSAATGNPHRIHYDRDYAHADGHRDVVVQGSLQANWLIEAMLSWAPDATLTAFTFRNVATAYVNDPFVVGGRVAEVHEHPDGIEVVVDLQVEGPDGATTVGRGTLLMTDGRVA